MNTRVRCPRCLEVFDRKRLAAGGKGTCPHCETPFRGRNGGEPARTTSRAVSHPREGTKACPYCAETIQSAAKKCRYCNEFLDPEMRRPERAPSLQFKGKRVRLPLGGVHAENKCWMCGTSAGVQRTYKKFHYYPPWTAILFLFTGLIGLIVMMASKKDSLVGIPMCGSCRSGWTLGTAAHYGYLLLGVFLVPLIFAFVGAATGLQGGALTGSLLGFAAWVIGIFVVEFMWVRRKQAVCTMIDFQFTELKFPRPDIVQRASLE